MTRSRQAGFTLVELMVVVAIVAILATGAVVAMNRDSAKADYDKLVAQIAQDLQWARFGALSSKEDRALLFSAVGWQVASVAPGTSVFALLRRQNISGEVEIKGFLPGAMTSGGNTPIPCTTAEIRFSAVGDLEIQGSSLGSCPGTSIACDTARCQCSVTVFVQTKDGRTQHRIVVFQSTGFTQAFEGW